MNNNFQKNAKSRANTKFWRGGFAFVPAILIVAAALIIGGGAYYLGSRNSTPQKTENSQTGNGNQESATNTPSDWKTYTNNKYGFELKYPSNLTIDSKENTGSYLETSGIFIDVFLSSLTMPQFHVTRKGVFQKVSPFNLTKTEIAKCSVYNRGTVSYGNTKGDQIEYKDCPGNEASPATTSRTRIIIPINASNDLVIDVTGKNGIEILNTLKFTTADTSNWKTYNFNFVKKLVIKYPPDWVLKEETYLSAAEYGSGKTPSVVGINLIPPYQGSSDSDRIVFGGVQSGGECSPSYEGSKYYTKCLESLVEMRTTSKNPKILVIFNQIAANIEVLN